MDLQNNENLHQKSPDRRRRPHRMRPTQLQVEAALKASHGLLEPAARSLGTSRGSLHTMIKRYARLEKVVKEQRQVMGDFAELKTFELMAEKHWPSIQYYLSTQCKDRGYVIPKGTTLGGDVTNSTTVIQSVRIEAVPSGRFIDDDEPLTIEGKVDEG